MSVSASAQVLDKRKLLTSETFWDNRDWDWYETNIPFFDCPDADIVTTYYYRWEVVTKHLVYGSPNSGYALTEFIDRPFWSGTYGAISCPAGHQLYEVRWLKEPRYARDYARYWFRTPGAQPRRYSTWLADSVYALDAVHPDRGFVVDLLPDLIANYKGWEQRHFVPEVGLFWQTGHDDGMEYNINSRQTQDIVRGAPAYRPTLNAYLYADALAIAEIARVAGDEKVSGEYAAKAKKLKENLQKKLWDPKRGFFYPLSMREEKRDGFTVKALTFTHQSGQFAGSEFGREQIGYVPWQFEMVDAGYESAWTFLMDPKRFWSEFGPTTVERQDPMFVLKPTCCWWSGQSWPYATTQTLKGMANLLQKYEQNVVSKSDYLKLLQTYAKTHRKEGRPYIAEAAHPDTGSWAGHDSPNHSEHYFHSGYTDLVITGLVGIRPRHDDVVEVHPLAPESWEYFALDDLPYRGRRLTVLWDKTGQRYGRGKGLRVLADGVEIAASETLAPITAKLPERMVKGEAPKRPVPVNYAVNNNGTYYPRLSASYMAPGSSVTKLIDGNYWYHVVPTNRWSAEGSPNAEDELLLDFGIPRRIHMVKLYFLDDGAKVTPPENYAVQHWTGDGWVDVPGQSRAQERPEGRRANWVRFAEMDVQKLRVVLKHGADSKAGLTEVEAWGDAALPVEAAPTPKGNLAYNPRNQPFPKVSASHTSRFDKVEEVIDGVVNFNPEPRNRWTSYESKSEQDWLEIDFGKAVRVGRVELAIYDDRGGVRAPTNYVVQRWTGSEWANVPGASKSPERPAGGMFNEVKFPAVETLKIRVLFTHSPRGKSGVSEVFVWPE